MPPRTRASRTRPWLRAPDPTPTPGLGRPCTGGVGCESPRTSFEVHNQKTAKSRRIPSNQLWDSKISSLFCRFLAGCVPAVLEAPRLHCLRVQLPHNSLQAPACVIARTKCLVRSSFGLRLDFPRKKTNRAVYRARSPIAIRGSAELASIHWRLRTRVK